MIRPQGSVFLEGGKVDDTQDDAQAVEKTRKRELLAFLFLTVVLAPAITIAIVGGYGFAVWMLQLIAGPPGPS